MQSGKSLRDLVGRPPSTPTISDSVLIIIDAQKEYEIGKLRLVDLDKSRKVIQSLLERYRTAHSEVIHVVADAPEVSPIFTAGTELAEILDELKPLDNETVIHKIHGSAFTGTTLQETLHQIGRTKLVLVGYMAHNCVSSTTRAGAELGYEISVVRDAVGDRDIPGVSAAELVRVSLAELADVVATVIDSKDL